MRSPKEEYRNDRPYKNNYEYLEELSVLMLLYVKNYIKHSVKEAVYRDSLDRINSELLGMGLSDSEDLAFWIEMINDREEISELANVKLSIKYVVKTLKLGEFGRDVLMLSLLAAIDSEWKKLISAITDNNQTAPNLDICGKLFLGSDFGIFGMYNYIYDDIEGFKIIFPDINRANEYMNIPLVCDERLIDILLGTYRCMPQEITMYEEKPQTKIMYRDEELEELSNLYDTNSVIILSGNRGAGKKHLIRSFLAKRDEELVLFDGTGIVKDESGLEKFVEKLNYAVRECLIWNMPLAVYAIDGFSDEKRDGLIAYIKDNIGKVVEHVFILSDNNNFATLVPDIYTLRLGKFDENQRIELWKIYSEGYELAEDVELIEVANTFTITPGQIKGALSQAYVNAGSKKLIDRKGLFKACYSQLKHKLAEKTSKVDSAFGWDDLKMDMSDKQVIRDICNCVKNRHTVMSSWNYSKVVPYGAGITVLFAGPPGTGKTMSAQVIANELNMELYKIDLSQIMDKYIGETEKNIKMIFEQAQKSNSILFFDEADAIFNKRMDAQGANERFANIESSLLLQCIEEYRGISILATNNFNSIDSAFIRRFKYFIQFREPDEATRYEIWKSAFPSEAPVSEDVDFKILAHLFDFTGAIIKNVSLAAAYLAAEEDRDISIVDILRSIKREMQKTNRILTKEKLGNLGYLFDEVIK